MDVILFFKLFIKHHCKDIAWKDYILQVLKIPSFNVYI